MNFTLLTANLKLFFRGGWWYLFVLFPISVALIASVLPDFAQYASYVYLIGPLFFLPVVSTTVALDRQKGTIRNFFTSPYSKLDYLATKFFQWLVLGLIYIVLTLPASLIYCYWSGSFYALLLSVLFSILMFAFIISLGLFISVLMVDQVRAATIFSSFIAIIFYLFYLSYPTAIQYSADPVLRFFRISPLVPAGDVFSLWRYSSAPFTIYRIESISPVCSVVFLMLLSVSLFVSSFMVFSRLQNVLGYDIRRKLSIAIVIVLLILPFLIPPSGYTVGKREFIRGTSLALELSVEPEMPLYDGDAVNASFRIFLPYGMSGLRSLTLDLYSPDIRFAESNFEFEYVRLRSEDSRAFFEIPATMQLEKVRGCIYGSYEVNINMLSRDRSDFLSATITIENRRAEVMLFLGSTLSLLVCLLVRLPGKRRLSVE